MIAQTVYETDQLVVLYELHQLAFGSDDVRMKGYETNSKPKVNAQQKC